MDRDLLRSGDRACVRFRFLLRPEYVRAGARLVFREGRTKAHSPTALLSRPPSPSPRLLLPNSCASALLCSLSSSIIKDGHFPAFLPASEHFRSRMQLAPFLPNACCRRPCRSVARRRAEPIMYRVQGIGVVMARATPAAAPPGLTAEPLGAAAT